MLLLTGTTGFLGSHLLKHWIDQGREVVALKRSTSSLKRLGDYANKCRWYDVDKAGWQKAFTEQKITAVVHVATDYGRGKPLSHIVESNVLLTLWLVEAARNNNVRLFINTDSFFNKGRLNYQYLGGYTLTKRMVELALPTYSEKDFKIVNIKLEHVYGPCDSKEKFATQMCLRLLRDEKNIAFTEGTQKRDFIYVSDVVSIYDTILSNYFQLKNFSEIPAGTGRAYSIREFIEKMKLIIGANTDLQFGSIPVRKGEFKESFADITILQALGWQPQYTLEQGLKEMIEQERKIV